MPVSQKACMHQQIPLSPSFTNISLPTTQSLTGCASYPWCLMTKQAAQKAITTHSYLHPCPSITVRLGLIPLVSNDCKLLKMQSQSYLLTTHHCLYPNIVRLGLIPLVSNDCKLLKKQPLLLLHSLTIYPCLSLNHCQLGLIPLVFND